MSNFIMKLYFIEHSISYSLITYVFTSMLYDLGTMLQILDKD